MYALVLVIGEFIDRIGERVCLISGLAIMALSTVMLAWVESILGTSVSLFLLGLGWNLSYVAASAELVTHATPVERGRLVGFTDLAAGLLARRSRSAVRPTRSGAPSRSPSEGPWRSSSRRSRSLSPGGLPPRPLEPPRVDGVRGASRRLPFVFVLMLWCTRSGPAASLLHRLEQSVGRSRDLHLVRAVADVHIEPVAGIDRHRHARGAFVSRL